MIDMLVQFLLALWLLWLVLVVVKVCRLVLVNRRYAGQSRGKLVLFLSNQERACEGFLRRLAFGCALLLPRVEMAVVVDEHSCDDTLGIARILGRNLGFRTLRSDEAAGEEKASLSAMLARLPGEPRNGLVGGKRPLWYYDARGLQGRSLLRTSVLRQVGLAA
ncbi:hypothetical protein [Desulfofundulus thermosubterraneus]|uniref:Uncharacterized protein n=1 Tax=Desulfofundulus thermosubterraneus DSM 16057 TaxID=1121432 RepID=A0A1M6I229_9FIRM|nr:hypothetical protein [Desulfofundulus thermosubterraneus]SHJ28529.1 hypothetical protein SAMN02745219_02190 [Desulfofundulus thermosubterraneus DSM 16057]